MLIYLAIVESPMYRKYFFMPRHRIYLQCITKSMNTQFFSSTCSNIEYKYHEYKECKDFKHHFHYLFHGITKYICVCAKHTEEL